MTFTPADIKGLLAELYIYNEMDVLDVIAGVVGRLAMIKGSRVAAINVLSVINPLLKKGKTITDQEWAETFEKLANTTCHAC